MVIVDSIVGTELAVANTKTDFLFSNALEKVTETKKNLGIAICL